MKYYIIAFALVIVCIAGMYHNQDYISYQRNLFKLKFVCEEAAAGASQYHDPVKYSEGSMVFNKDEGIKAAEYIIQEQLKLDTNFVPKAESYWQDKVTYKIEFLDDSNTTYPYLYKHSGGNVNIAVSAPTVIVTIYPGKGRFRTGKSPITYRVAAHQWQDR